jgi:hypothetical protein
MSTPNVARIALQLTSTTRSRMASTLAALLLVAGCDAGGAFVDVGDGRDRPVRDGGANDGAVGGDGGTGDGGDGGTGSGGDGGNGSGGNGGGGTSGDGGMYGDDDGGSEPEIDVSNCTLSDDDDFDVAVPFVEGGFAIAPGAVDFGLAYMRNATCKHALDTVPIDSSGGAIPPATTVIENCKNMPELTLANSSDGWHLAWTDNSTGTIELHTALLDDQLGMSADARSVVTNDLAVERRPMMADVAGHPVLAWIAETLPEHDRRLLSKRLGQSGDPIEILPASDEHVPVELAIAQIGAEHGAIAWVEEVASRGIWLQSIDGDGEAVGDPRLMTEFAASGSTVDLATREDEGGAAVYSIGLDQVNFEVRFRRLNVDASFRNGEIKVISSPLQAKDAGIARLGGGYAIAYRAIPDGGVIKDPQIRLVFVSKEGNASRDAQGRVITFPVAASARDGSRVQVEVSVDGQLLIAFVDGSDSTANVLRVVRRRLDCGL